MQEGQTQHPKDGRGVGYGKKTWAIGLGHFFPAYQRAKGNVMFDYCPTGEMIADFLVKALQGQDLRKLRPMIMGCAS